MAEQINTKLDIKGKLIRDGVISSADFATMAGSAEVAPDTGEVSAGEDDAVVETKRREEAESRRAAEYAAIPAADRAAFEQAVIHDGRFVKSYKLLDGKFSVTFQSRTMRESTAAIQSLRKYSDSLRLSNPETRAVADAALLALQITELNGEAYPAVTGVLVPTVLEDGGKSEPAWYGRIEKWMDASEARLNLVLGAYREFERLYQSLCDTASVSSF